MGFREGRMGKLMKLPYHKPSHIQQYWGSAFQEVYLDFAW
jgi:hypothetical protein